MSIAFIHLYLRHSTEIHPGTWRQAKGSHDLATWCPGIRCHFGAGGLILLHLNTTGNDTMDFIPQVLYKAKTIAVKLIKTVNLLIKTKIGGVCLAIIWWQMCSNSLQPKFSQEGFWMQQPVSFSLCNKHGVETLLSWLCSGVQEN